MADSIYGYWAYNNNQNGLKGAADTIEELPDGRKVTHKNPQNPTVLPDQFIIYGLQHVRQARNDFNRLFPSLDTESQARLTELIENNPRASGMVKTDQVFLDAIQRKDVTSGVRVRLPRLLRVNP